MIRASLAIALLLASGCGVENAILEVHLQLPAQRGSGDETLLAFVQVRPAEGFPFSAEWRGSDELQPLLLGPEPIEDHVSVESLDARSDLNVRVTFCTDAACSESGFSRAPQAWFTLERPFYLTERTEWHHSILAVPPGVPEGPAVVSPCEIRGCVNGDLAPDYCTGGVHPCQ